MKKYTIYYWLKHDLVEGFKHNTEYELSDADVLNLINNCVSSGYAIAFKHSNIMISNKMFGQY